MSDFDPRIILAEDCFQLLDECNDEADMEYIVLALGDPKISTPSLQLGRGTGSVNAAKADEKHAGVVWNLMKPYDKRFGVIATVPLRVALRRNLPAGIEYRMGRKVNPLQFHQALSIGFGELKLIMKAKKFIGGFVNPDNEVLFDSLTRKQLRRHTLDQIKSSH